MELLSRTAFHIGAFSLDDRQQQEAVRGIWLCEITELAGMSKADVDKTKGLRQQRVGWDFGGDGARTMMLVYSLPETQAIYQRFAGIAALRDDSIDGK